ncbi:hypothetical protein CIB95_08760 [Lottiidibacillus patelloidae]|uniref:Uncharacterized protein n=1 Tax=Lottiidibacillus patelloidae TaxID=2670334 RepID=A0A263BTF7_9BACI|nr:hypothetical protein [Lottiidibacillus patelloidae]OZM56852.1 hypothetical protein CIB95_08760 [Lottiidibacillus patelloidae]
MLVFRFSIFKKIILKVFIVLLLLTGQSAIAHAKTADGIVEKTESIIFKTQNQKVWENDLHEAIPLVYESFYEEGFIEDDAENFTGYYYGKIGGGASGEFGVTAHLNFDAGKVDITYPIDVKLTIPEEAKYKPGETFTIDSSWEIADGWAMTATGPKGSAYIDMNFALKAWAYYKVRDPVFFPDYKEGALFPTIDIADRFDITPTVTDETNENFSLDKPELDIESTIKFPNMELNSSNVRVEDKKLVASTSDSFFEFFIEFDKKIIRTPDEVDEFLEDLLDFLDVDIDYTIFNAILDNEAKVDQNVVFDPRIMITLPFSVPVNYTELNADGSIVKNETSQFVRFQLGNSVEIEIPDVNLENFSVYPTYNLSNHFSNSTIMSVNNDITFEALSLDMDMPVIPTLYLPPVVYGDFNATLSTSVYDNTWSLNGFNTQTGNLLEFGLIDKTPPVIRYLNNQRTYMVDEHIDIKCDVTDNLSGVESHTCEDINADAYTFALGEHTFSSEAIDEAGNTASNDTSFTVDVDIPSLINLTKRFVEEKGVQNELVKKLENATHAFEREKDRQGFILLTAFHKQLYALNDKWISDEHRIILRNYTFISFRELLLERGKSLQRWVAIHAGATEEEAEEKVRTIWENRDERYSEISTEESYKQRKIKMSYIGE